MAALAFDGTAAASNSVTHRSNADARRIAALARLYAIRN